MKKYIRGFGTQNRPDPENDFSLAQISNSDVLLRAVNPAEEGIDRGTTAKVWNQPASLLTYNLSIFGVIT